MAEVKGLAIHTARSQKQHGDKPQEAIPTAAIIEGRKVEKIVSDEQWERWLSQEARFIHLTQARSTTLDLAPSIIETCVLNNSWRGISVVIAEGEQKNDIQPEITDFKSAVNRLKEMTDSRVTPLVIHPDGRREEGIYKFDNPNFSGIIFIDAEASASSKAVSEQSEELADLSESTMVVKQGQIEGVDDGGGQLTFNGEAVEIKKDDQATALSVSDLAPEDEEVKEVRELINFEEIEDFQSRAQGNRFTLTVFVFAKQPKLETPVQNQSNAQTQEFVNGTAPVSTSVTPAPAGSNPFGGAIPDFGKYVSFAPGALDPDQKN